MTRRDDPVLARARREAGIIALAWALYTAVCCVTCARLGYDRPDRPLGPADVHPTFGMPAWFFWGVIVPWAASGVFTALFVAFGMTDDDLGSDQARHLDAEIREASDHAG